MMWQLISLPLVAAVIGWGTNVIAIKMLFWPRKPINLFGWEFLGVLPKRKTEIARSIGDVLNDDLLPTNELIEAVNTPEIRAKVTTLISANIAAKIDRFLPRFLSDYAGGKIKDHVEDLVKPEIEDLFGKLGTTVSEELLENKLLGNLVEEKINSFDLGYLEQLVLKVAKNELRYIEYFGALLGFIIGLIQVAFIVLLPS